MSGNVEAALGGAFLAFFGDDADGMRAVVQRDGLHFHGCRHFEVQGQAQHRHQAVDVAVRDMAAILAQMGGDAIGAGLFRQLRGTHRVGPRRAARVANGGHVIDIDAKTLHASPLFARRLALCGRKSRCGDPP